MSSDNESISNSEKSDDDKNDKNEKNDSKKISKEFQENVIKFTKIDDTIRDKQKEITKLRSQRKLHENYILKHLDQIDESVIEISNGKLIKSKSETKVPLNQDIVKNAIKEKISDPTIVEEIIKNMDNSRQKNTRVNLKRTNNK